MTKTVYCQVGSVRRTPRVPMARKATSTQRSGFDSLLVKLGLASGKLQQSRSRNR